MEKKGVYVMADYGMSGEMAQYVSKIEQRFLSLLVEQSQVQRLRGIREVNLEKLSKNYKDVFRMLHVKIKGNNLTVFERLSTIIDSIMSSAEARDKFFSNIFPRDFGNKEEVKREIYEILRDAFNEVSQQPNNAANKGSVSVISPVTKDELVVSDGYDATATLKPGQGVVKGLPPKSKKDK